MAYIPLVAFDLPDKIVARLGTAAAASPSPFAAGGTAGSRSPSMLKPTPSAT
jgi:hypothetical protein